MQVTPQRWSLQDLLSDPVEESLEAALADLETKVSTLEAQRDIS